MRWKERVRKERAEHDDTTFIEERCAICGLTSQTVYWLAQHRLTAPPKACPRCGATYLRDGSPCVTNELVTLTEEEVHPGPRLRLVCR